MEIFLFLLLCAVLAVVWTQNRELAGRVGRLERQIDDLLYRDFGDGWGREPERPEPEAMETPEREAEPEPAWRAEAWREPAPEAAPEATPEPAESEGLGGVFERLVAGKLLIWIGGIALVVAGVFLVRHSIEIGLVTPELRMIAAAAFGLLLLGAGEYARTGRLFEGDPRFGQALVGAGIAVLYATAYGAYFLYGLLGPGAASAAMVGVTAAALVLSLRHGAPTAVMGLVGGFLTPALVGDPDAGAVPLLFYLALLNGALFAIAWQRGWTWLAAAAVAGSFVWTALLLAAPPDDAVAAGAFIVLLAVAASFLRPGEGRHLFFLQPAAIGLVQLAVLVGRTDVGPVAWALFGALSAASVILALVRPAFRFAAPLALFLALALLAAKAVGGEDPLLGAAAAGTTLLFGGAGLALAARGKALLWTLVAAVGIAGPAAVLRAAAPELLAGPAWGALTAGLALAACLLAWAVRERAKAEPPADVGLLAAASAAALLAMLAVLDLAPSDLVAAGWAAVALAAAAAARRLDARAPVAPAILAAAAATVRGYAMVPELSAALITALIGEPVLADDLPGAAAALWALALPAALFLLVRRAMPGDETGARRGLAATAGVFAAAALYVWYKQAWGIADGEEFVRAGFAERALLTQMLFAGGWLLARNAGRFGRLDPDLLRAAGTALTAFAAARLVWLDLLVLNPALVPQWVAPVPVLNLCLSFLLAAAWLHLARRRAEREGSAGAWFVLFLAALAAGTALLVRQAFQGAYLAGPELPRAEFYMYSLAGLVLSAGLLVAGIRLADKALRLAGLAFLTATIVKVFLVDASELEGILRILSFLGLGAFLIGIGRLYGPVLRAGQE